MGLDAVELLVEAEEHFGVEVPDEVAEKCQTVGQFAQALTDLRATTGAPIEYDVVLLQLRNMIADKFGFRLEEVVPEARFVDDLGLSQ